MVYRSNVDRPVLRHVIRTVVLYMTDKRRSKGKRDREEGHTKTPLRHPPYPSSALTPSPPDFNCPLAMLSKL